MTYNGGACPSSGIRRRTKPIGKSIGLSFDEATELFTSGTDFLEIYDGDHSGEEDRFIAIGPIHAGLVVVVYTERQDDIIRIVSARKATKKEVELFRKYQGGIND